MADPEFDDERSRVLKLLLQEGVRTDAAAAPHRARRRLLGVAGLVVVAVIVAITVAEASSHAPVVTDAGPDRPPALRSTAGPSESDLRALFASVGGRGDSSSSWFSFQATLADHLPNARFEFGGKPLVSAGVVIGTVTHVEPGTAYRTDPGVQDPDAGDSGYIEVPWDSPLSEWRDVIVTLDVETAYGSQGGKQQVTLGLQLWNDDDAAAQLRALSALGRVVVPIGGPNFFRSDPDAFTIARNGELLGLVARDGAISFPALGEDAGTFLDGIVSVDDLAAAAAGPVRDVVVVKG